MLQQLAEALARIAKLGREGRNEQAEEELAQACGQLLGVEHAVLTAADVPTAVMLLRDPEKVRAYADLLETEAQLLALRGDDAAAAKRRERAAALLTRG